MSDSVPVETRQAQKERTRQAILASALELSQTQGFGHLSLRQVSRHAGIVPTAFYRHFESMDELGLALVEQCFRTLRSMIRDAQRDSKVFDNIIDSSAEILVGVVKQNKADFGFIARERFGGQSVVQQAIRRELEAFVSELAVLLGRLPNIENWDTEDVQMVSRLFVRNMVSNAEEVVEMPDGRPDLEEKIKEGARRQMRLIVIGFKEWNPGAPRSSPLTPDAR